MDMRRKVTWKDVKDGESIHKGKIITRKIIPSTHICFSVRNILLQINDKGIFKPRKNLYKNAVSTLFYFNIQKPVVGPRSLQKRKRKLSGRHKNGKDLRGAAMELKHNHSQKPFVQNKRNRSSASDSTECISPVKKFRPDILKDIEFVDVQQTLVEETKKHGNIKEEIKVEIECEVKLEIDNEIIKEELEFDDLENAKEVTREDIEANNMLKEIKREIGFEYIQQESNEDIDLTKKTLNSNNSNKMARRKILSDAEMIKVLDETDEISEAESDVLEAEIMYDSDEDAEYVPDPKEVDSDVYEDYTSDSSVEEQPRKRRKTSGTARRQRLPPQASTADPALLDAVDTTLDTPLAVTNTAPAVTSSATPAAPFAVTPTAPAVTTSTGPVAVTPTALAITSPTAPAVPCQRSSSHAAATAQPIITFSTATVNSKSYFVWNTRPQHLAAARIPAINIVRSFSPGPTQLAAQVTTEEECFNLFLTDDIINEIVMSTNQKIDVVAQRYKRQTATVKRTSAVEIRAFIGILIFSGYKHDNHLQTKEMWCPMSGAPFYKAAMSEVRFAFLLQCLRFDDFTTRNERRATDKLAPIRCVWDKFIFNCKLHYTAHENLTVDEQLVGFRGRCPFRMYIPDKPGKYGIKLVMMNDAETKYMLNAIPYLGKDASVPKEGLQLGHMYTKQLTQQYHHTNRNVTTDNWFTSVPLITDLAKNCGMTLVGTVRANKKEIPDVMKEKKTRAPGSSAFLFTKEMTLVSYLPNKATTKKVVLLLSSMHRQPTVVENGKPEIITFYNKTKGGTDTFDQMCAQYSCSRKTNRWPMCLFFGIINAALVNSFIIYRENKMKVQPGKKTKRRHYMRELALQLIKPYYEERVNAPTQQRQVKLLINQVCSLNPSPTGAAGGPSAAEMKEPMVRCKLCQSKADKKTRFRCHTCRQPVCPLHYFPICSSCV